ncbi:DUF2199 domain-containing protein [Corynebacterium pacaense]|uniref:DUF2199 domain-containing protein n=1 Tax=Corynebacterium pacaense TaxID=1816684 RepID=UPI0009B9B38B|nr:DUF2199 domain-containing protein [Corynebacterium pacaense]
MEPVHFRCSCCNHPHEGLPALTMMKPDAIVGIPEGSGEYRIEIGTEICRIMYPKPRSSFVRANLMLPIRGTSEVLDYGVWVRLTERDFQRYRELQSSIVPTMFNARLANEIPGYSGVLNHPVTLHLRGATLRPMIQPDPDCDSDFAGDCVHGITAREARLRIDSWLLPGTEQDAA